MNWTSDTVNVILLLLLNILLFTVNAEIFTTSKKMHFLLLEKFEPDSFGNFSSKDVKTK